MIDKEFDLSNNDKIILGKIPFKDALRVYNLVNKNVINSKELQQIFLNDDIQEALIKACSNARYFDNSTDPSTITKISYELFENEKIRPVFFEVLDIILNEILKSFTKGQEKEDI